MAYRIIAALLLAGCAAQPAEPEQYDGYAWQGKIGEGARVFGSGLAAHQVFLDDAEGCDWVGLRQPKEQREALFQQCMALRGWLPVKLPK